MAKIFRGVAARWALPRQLGRHPTATRYCSCSTVVSLYSDVPYDPIKDFAPVTLVATSPYVLVVPPSLGISSGALDRILAPGGGSHDFHWIAPRTDSIAHSRREWDESNISGRTTPLKSLTELIQHNRPTSRR